MMTNTSMNLTGDAWVKRVGKLRQELEDNYSAFDCTYTETAEWMLSDGCEAFFDQDDAAFLRKEAERKDS